jgi:hypothetical protein
MGDEKFMNLKHAYNSHCHMWSKQINFKSSRLTGLLLSELEVLPLLGGFRSRTYAFNCYQELVNLAVSSERLVCFS